MEQPLLSIVIPAYNYGHLLTRAVISVLPQLGHDAELVVINDGSTDNTDTVIETLTNKHPGKFRYLKTENSGLAATRNRGIDETTGRYLIFLDADDELAPDGVDTIRQGIVENPHAKMLIGGHVAIGEDGARSYHGPGRVPEGVCPRLRAYLLDKSLTLANGAVAMHRAVFRDYRYKAEFRSSEDLPVFAYVLANFPVVAMDKAVLVLHKHSDSLRHNPHLAKAVGLKLVDEVFDPGRIPSEAQMLKQAFAVQRYLSLSRTCSLAGDSPACIQFYRQALANDWRVLFKFSYTRKAFRACFR